MIEAEQQELMQLVLDFQELLKSNYLQCCPCCGTFFNDEFDDKRKELLRRTDELLYCTPETIEDHTEREEDIAYWTAWADNLQRKAERQQ